MNDQSTYIELVIEFWENDLNTLTGTYIIITEASVSCTSYSVFCIFCALLSNEIDPFPSIYRNFEIYIAIEKYFERQISNLEWLFMKW